MITPRSILILYLAFFIAEFLFENALTVLNILHIGKRRRKVPEQFQGFINQERYNNSVEYTLAHSRFSLFSSPIESAFILAIVLTGALGMLNHLITGLSVSGYITAILYVFSVSLLFTLFSLPFSLYSQFKIEERFQFNNMTLGLFFIDLIKSLLLSAVIAFPLLFIFFRLVDAAGSLWWVYAFIVLSLFQLVISFLYPVLIAPLFNTFTPLEEDSLREKVELLAERLDFKTKGIYVMDGSKRSGHSNAYFTGLGKAKRIVFFDTLLDTLAEDEIVAVLAHELGHEKLRHVRKRLFFSFALGFLGMYIVARLLDFPPLFYAFGFEAASIHGLLVILGFCSGPFTFFLKPLLTSWSRKHEYEADRFAVQTLGEEKSLKEALITLSRENLSNLVPHPLYSFYHYSHPSLGERLAALDTVASGCRNRQRSERGET